MKIVVLIEKYGGFANRLFQSLHFHAFAIENKVLFFNPSMLGLLRFDNRLFYFLDGLNNLFLKVFAKMTFYLLKKNNYQISFGKESYIRFVGGWDYRVNNLTEKHYEKLKVIYKFKNNNEYKRSNFENNYLKLRKKNRYLVVFHIRRGDYQKWNDGKFFFDDKFYKKAIYKLRKELISENKDPYIIGISDEKLNLHLGLDYIHKGSWKDDQILLQNCDLILGPPSTFTLWSSYISRIPLIHLKSIKDINLKNKKICKG
jgi:hypothetical protein